VGLANIRARLQSLYGERGRLMLLPQSPRGVIAELRLPLEWS
jgi:sensor histidine kinase YesM